MVKREKPVTKNVPRAAASGLRCQTSQPSEMSRSSPGITLLLWSLCLEYDLTVSTMTVSSLLGGPGEGALSVLDVDDPSTTYR